MRHFKSLSALLLAAATVGFASPSGSAADLLTIGSDAPALNVEHWVQDGKGKFKPVTKFEKGKVYVVEFWATWCGPCIQSMPHLAELQTKYADKGVQLISISDEDLETVDKFLDREVRGSKAEEGKEDAKPKTYRELTSVYCLTTDPDQSTNKDYMEAAAQNGIPTAFIVGKDSKIEWIGHPMEMDDPLAAVVGDKWDRAAYLKIMKERQEAEQAMQEIGQLVQGKKFPEAVAAIDKLLAKGGDNLQMKMVKLQILLMGDMTDEATKHTASLFKEISGNPEMVNMVAWSLVEMTEQGRLKSDAMLDDALVATEKAVAATPQETKASIMDTLAHLYALKGNKAKAIEIEEEAVKLATGQDLEFMKQFLAELKEPAEPTDKDKADKDK